MIQTDVLGYAAIVDSYVPTVLKYAPDKPAEVSITFDGIEWVVGRDLLAGRYKGPMGDMGVTAFGSRLYILLRGDREALEIVYSKAEIYDFLNRTYSLRPDSSYDVDAIIAGLLDDDWSGRYEEAI